MNWKVSFIIYTYESFPFCFVKHRKNLTKNENMGIFMSVPRHCCVNLALWRKGTMYNSEDLHAHSLARCVSRSITSFTHQRQGTDKNAWICLDANALLRCLFLRLTSWHEIRWNLLRCLKLIGPGFYWDFTFIWYENFHKSNVRIITNLFKSNYWAIDGCNKSPRY